MICLALLATVLEYSLLEMEEEVVAVGDLVALLDLTVGTVTVGRPVLGSAGQCWANKVTRLVVSGI